MIYVSVNFKPDHSPSKPPGNFFKGGYSPPLDTKKVQNSTPWVEKSCKILTPGAIIFKNSAKATKHKTKVMKNSNEMLLCLEILKQ